jgi:hypothetical protein
MLERIKVLTRRQFDHLVNPEPEIARQKSHPWIQTTVSTQFSFSLNPNNILRYITFKWATSILSQGGGLGMFAMVRTFD